MTRKRTRRRVPRATLARVGYFLGVLLVAAGLGLALNLGWGLIAAGLGLIAYVVLLYDVDEPQPIDDDGGLR